MSQRLEETTLTDFTDGDDFQTFFMSSCSTASAEVTLVEDAPGPGTQTHVHSINDNRKCPRH